MKHIFYLASIMATLLATTPAELNARIVKGKVTCGEQNLSKVIVTDGTNFTRTKKN